METKRWSSQQKTKRENDLASPLSRTALEGQACIGELATSEEVESRGVGKTLACEQWARNQGYRLLSAHGLSRRGYHARKALVAESLLS